MCGSCVQPARAEPYPTDVSDEEWASVAPTRPCRARARPGGCCRATSRPGRRRLSGRRAGSRPGCSRRWSATRASRCATSPGAGGAPRPPCSTAARSAPLHARESGARAGCDVARRPGARRPRAAADTPGDPPAARITPASGQDQARVGPLAAAVREANGEAVELAYVDRGCTGERPARDAGALGVRLAVVRRAEGERGFVLLPRRRVVERGFARAARRRRLARDYERLPGTLAGLRFLALAHPMVARAAPLLAKGPRHALGSGLDRTTR
jgi:transposase